MREKRVLIVGCGYLGKEVANRLAGMGAAVTGWVRSREGAAVLPDGVKQAVIGDAADPKLWERLPAAPDAVIHAASSGRAGPEAYDRVYREGMRQITAHCPRARLLLISSTSVYGQADGGRVTEESPAEPAVETGQILRAAEDIALAAGGVVVRAAGIYGPGRSVLWRKFLSGEAVIEGDGSRWVNQIHRDDLAAAVIHLLGREDRGIFNAVDDHPVSLMDFYCWCARKTGKPLPRHGPVNLNRKRGLTNKRVDNAKLRAAGWTPVFPSFREGLAAAPF